MTAPQVTTFTPSGVTVSAVTGISVTFSEAMNKDTVAVALSPEHNLGTGTWSNGYKTLSFTPTTPLPYSTTFTASVSGSDYSGNALGEKEFLFTTRDAPMFSSSPSDEEAGVASRPPVVLTFNEPMNTASVIVSATDGTNAVALGTGTWTGDTVLTFTPTFTFATTYTVALDAGKTAGGDPCVPTAFAFTTGPQPKVSSSSPGPGATNVTTSSNISVTFNAKMDKTTVPGAFSGVACAAYAWNDPLDTVFTCVPQAGALAANSSYTFSVSTAAKSAGGDAISPAYSATFTTVLQDVTPPTLVSVTPTSGTTNAGPGGTIVFKFSEPMDKTAVAPGTPSVVVGSTSRPGTISWDATGQQMTFTPSTAFAKGDSVSWTIAFGTVKDVAGNFLATSSTGWFHVVRVATKTLPLVAASSGYIKKNTSKLGTNYYPTTGAPSPSYAGDDIANDRYRTFWTFDLKALTNPTAINSATLGWYVSAIAGTPSYIGTLYARGVYYGSTLDGTSADWAAPDDPCDYLFLSGLQATTALIIDPIPIPCFKRHWQIALVTGAGSADVTRKVRGDFADATRAGRCQFSTTFLDSAGNQTEVYFNYVTDRVSFSASPTLIVNYDQAW